MSNEKASVHASEATSSGSEQPTNASNAPVETKTEAATPERVSPSKSMSRSTIISLFMGLCFACFVSALDETIVATAAVPITADFNGFSLYSWVPVAYLVAIDASQPLYGRISDVFGRRPVLLFGLLIFFLGSAGCGWAPNMPFFLAARAVAGIGAGGLVGMAYIIISDVFPIEEGPQWRSYLGFGFAAATTLGPVLGGVLSTETTWRWCFWINLPFVAVTILIIIFTLKLPPLQIDSYKAALLKIDFVGGFFLVATIASLILPLSLAGSYWKWNSPQVIALFVIFGVALAAFVFWARAFSGEALIPWRLLTNKALLASWAVLFCYGMSFITFLYYLPIWSQVVEGRTSVIAGVKLLPILGAMIVNGFSYRYTIKLAEKLPFPPFRVMLTTGGLVHLIGAVLVGATFTPKLHVAAQVIFLFIYGIGCGLIIQTSFILAQISVDRADLAVANSITVLFQNLGDVVGLAIAGAITRGKLRSAFNQIPADVADPSILDAILQNPERVHESGLLSEEAQQIVVNDFVSTLQLILRIAIAFAGAALLASFLTKPPPKAPKPAPADEEKGKTDATPAESTDEKESNGSQKEQA